MNEIRNFENVLSEYKFLRHRLYKESMSPEERQETLHKTDILSRQLKEIRLHLAQKDFPSDLQRIGSNDENLIKKLLLRGIVISHR